MNGQPPDSGDFTFEKLTPKRWFARPRLRARVLELPPEVGARILGLSDEPYVGFSEARGNSPRGAPSVLEGVSELTMPRATARRLARLQERVNVMWRATRTASFAMGPLAKAAQAANSRVESGAPLAFVAQGRDAALVEQATSLLANVAGVTTPLASSRCLIVEGRRVHGVVRLEPQRVGRRTKLDLHSLPPRAAAYLLHARWFSELLGFGLASPELLVTHDDALVCSFGEPFSRTARLGRRGSSRFDPTTPVAFRPDHFDAQSSAYGRILRAFVVGELEVDFGELETRLDDSRAVPERAVRLALGGLASDELVARYYRSLDEYATHVNELSTARGDPGHPLRLFFLASA